MEERMKRNGYGYCQAPNPCDRKDKEWDNKGKECDIESVCCDDFVKEQFSLRTIATNNVLIVYQSTGGSIARGTIKVQNLSSNTSIIVVVNSGANSRNVVVGPNQEGALTSNDLTVVTVQALGGPNSSARVQLCFDLQVAALGD